jgi:hypothetical protein
MIGYSRFHPKAEPAGSIDLYREIYVERWWWQIKIDNGSGANWDIAQVTVPIYISRGEEDNNV